MGLRELGRNIICRTFLIFHNDETSNIYNDYAYNVAFLSYAQRLNEQGLKMVSEIEVRSYMGHRFLGTTKYVFDYYNTSNLVSMRIIDSDNKLWEENNKMGNRI